MEIRARTAAYPSEDFKGKVSSIDSRLDPVSRAVTVRARIDNSDGRLKPGMFMTVRLMREEAPALLIPEQALHRTPDGAAARAPYDPMPHGPAEVGVGPWEGPWPVGEQYDAALLADGDRRNVVDRYRYWRREAVVADLDRRRHDFHVAIENWQHDFNIGTVVRTANAFLAREVHIIGRRRWNRRGAMVTDRYQHVRHHETIEAFVAWAAAESLPVLGIDNLPGSKALERHVLPRRCVLLFGQEGPGLSDAARAACGALYSIAQYGSTRSINAGVASGIAMHAWIQAHADPPE
jgi:tRNA(Leu) C34 or U34 (ribose-2'-O)-methylase TrmL